MVAEIGAAAGRVSLVLADYEADILRGLLGEMRALLDGGVTADPVIIERLFPSAYEDDADQAAYEELIGGELRDHKKHALTTATLALGSEGGVSTLLDEDEASDWLTLLTDMRLAIGTRLEVTEDTMDRELDPNDRETPAYAVLHWLGWLQDAIVTALGASPAAKAPEEET